MDSDKMCKLGIPGGGGYLSVRTHGPVAEFPFLKGKFVGDAVMVVIVLIYRDALQVFLCGAENRPACEL